MHIADVADTPHAFSGTAATTDETSTPRSRGIGSLRFQFLILLCVAMGPVAILGILQAISAFSSERHRIEEGYFQTVSADARVQQQTLVTAYNLLTSVSQQRAVRRGLDPMCESIMREALNQTPGFASMIATDADGRVICSSSSTDPAASHAATAWLQDVLAGANYSVSAAATDGSLQGQALRAATPLRDENGKIVGSLSVVIPLTQLDRPPAFNALPETAFSAIVRADGTVLAAVKSAASLATLLPDDGGLQDILQHPGTVQRIVGADGHKRMFAAIALDPGVEMLFAQDAGGRWGGIDIGPIVFPILMWLVALVTIWLVVERLVLRWTVYLGRIAAAYGRGHFIVMPHDTEDAPQEFRELGRTLADMARLVRDRQRQLQAALEQKNTLVREVNHRVKNNLQIIQSLLNLQARTIENRQQLSAFVTARNRVSALAMIHQSLYDAESLEYVELKTFFEQLCRHLLASGWADSKEIAMDVDVPEVIVTADMAVPLTLLVTEAVTNALKHAFVGRRTGEIKLRLGLEGDESVLTIQDNGVGMDLHRRKRKRNVGIGQSLMAGFARQLRGTVENFSDNGTVVRVKFPSLLRKST